MDSNPHPDVIDVGPDCAGDIERLENDIFPSDAMSRAAIDEFLSRPWARATGVSDGKRLVAYCLARYLGHTNPEGELLTIGVDSDYRGRGYGRQLMDDLVTDAAARGCREIFLEVRRSNHHAIDLYKQVGFTVIDRRKNYYAHPREDALIMRLYVHRARRCDDKASMS